MQSSYIRSPSVWSIAPKAGDQSQSSQLYKSMVGPNATQCSVNLLALESSAFEAFYGFQLILINSTDRSKFNLMFIFNFDWSKAASAGKSFHTENDFKNLLFANFDISTMVSFNFFRFSRKISLRMP